MISYIVGFLLIGGFYDFSISATAICVVAEILFHYHKKKPVYQKKKNYILWFPVIMLVWSACICLWAIDVSEQLLGSMRIIVLLLWMYRCYLMEEQEKETLLHTIPYLGAGMVLVSIVSLVHENLAANFWQARRLGGFFQYSNTCALFLMLGIVVMVQKRFGGKKVSKKEDLILAATIGLLLFGILLTGSRSVLLLLFAWGVYRSFRVKALRIPFAVVSVVGLGGAYLYGLLASDEQNIARIFTLFTSNSTILGRLLYDIDALSIALKHPLGLGYMGYYYIQPAVQTGVYTTRYIHNDWLQLLVDYGFVALALGVIYMVWQFRKGKQSAEKKEILLLLLAASFVDFHLQYLSMVMLMVLCLDLGECDKVKKQKELRENYLFCVVGIVISLYVSVAFLALYVDKYDVALTLLPGYTEAQVQKLNICADKDEAIALADELLERNEYVSEAYHSKVYAFAMEGNFEKAVECMERSLSIRRYDVATYRAYDELLTEMIAMCVEEQRIELAVELEEYKATLPQKLAELEKTTHPIAFRLRDVPVFEW